MSVCLSPLLPSQVGSLSTALPGATSEGKPFQLRSWNCKAVPLSQESETLLYLWESLSTRRTSCPPRDRVLPALCYRRKGNSTSSKSTGWAALWPCLQILQSQGCTECHYASKGPLSEKKNSVSPLPCPAGLLSPVLSGAVAHSLEARRSLATSDMIYISMLHFTLIDTKGHFKRSFTDKVLYLSYDKTLQQVTIAQQCYDKQQRWVLNSYIGNSGRMSTVSYNGSGWYIRTNIVPVLTKDGTDVSATRFSVSEDNMSWDKNPTEKL